MSILEKIRALELPKNEFVVMGSAILDIKGIRKAEDLDIIVTEELFEDFKKSPAWEYKSKIGTLGGVKVESLGNHDGASLYKYIYGGGDIDFFRNHQNRIEEIDGICFVSLSNLLEVKTSSWDRDKDKEDAKLIKDYLAKKERSHYIP